MRALAMALTGAAIALAGCASTGEAGGVTQPGGSARSGECDATPAQSLVAQQATAEVGQRIMSLTGARQLRWGAPGTAMTMDFRQDRVNVFYNQAMRIERISCG